MLQLSGTMKTMTKLYEQAGQTAAEAVENMRTVSSLCIERLFLKKYADCLIQPSQLVLVNVQLHFDWKYPFVQVQNLTIEST